MPFHSKRLHCGLVHLQGKQAMLRKGPPENKKRAKKTENRQKKIRIKKMKKINQDPFTQTHDFTTFSQI